MPTVQRGQTYKLQSRDPETGRPLWAYRYRDEHGRRRQVGGFRSKTEAGTALDAALERARLGPLAAARRDWTLSELVDRYLEQHQAAPATIARLKAMLAKATGAFGDVPVQRLLPDEIGRWAKRLPDGHRHDAMVALRSIARSASSTFAAPSRAVRFASTGRRTVLGGAYRCASASWTPSRHFPRVSTPLSSSRRSEAAT
jgi:hypothetical protein